jgi:putative endonuclease
MGYYVYILESNSSGRLYIGQTQNIENRVNEHNEGMTKSTKGKGPWKLLHSKVFETRTEAMVFERKLKNWKSSLRVLEWIDREKAGR